jgi:ketosteroid isomerase-like protein
MIINDPVVAAFVDATNAHDAEALAGLFGADSVVVDDGTEYRGTERIAGWIQEHQIAPKITLAVGGFDDTTLVLTASADGDFPGGPLPFRFCFVLGDGIERLEVTPVR